ncbi:MAG: ATP-binding protein [Synergistaceae bacterium]|jgi:predicted AAA+ superfamily ATPase|nr:ATP-binding protein [Synergistaceae bacterium]
MIERAGYLKKLRLLRDDELIKVVTGVRRAGKSTLLHMFRDELLADGVEPARITAINFEEEERFDLSDWRQLHQYLTKKLIPDKMNYIFLDEVQHVDEFERLTSSLAVKKNVDLYLTGSNAKLLSSELATLLTGRYYEINLLPFSFKEYISAFNDQSSLGQKLTQYMFYGSFPHALKLFRQDADLVDGYLKGIYNTVLNKDVVARKKISDPQALGEITKFLFDNIGNFTSSNKIAMAISAASRSISHHTVSSYVSALTDSFLFYPVNRLNVKGKKLLQTQQKYYAVDLGLRQMLLGREALADVGHMLENVVYLELLRRSSQVWIGKAGNGEVDFIVQDKSGYTSYYQVAYTAREQSTLERELAPLRWIKDHSPKYLITLDEEQPAYEGIRKINAIEFLLS